MNGNLTQTALTQYVETQKNLRTIINDYVTRATEKKLQSIYKNGYSSKSYCNITRQLRQNSVEDLYTLREDDEVRLFSEDETKNYTNQFYKQLYSKHSLLTYEKEWSNYIENKIDIYQENRSHESDEYNHPIHLNEVKGALNLLRKKKGEDPDTIKNELLKYRAEAIAILLKDYVQQILQSEDIPTQWNSSTLINTGKGRQDKEKLDNKRGTSLTSSIAKLFEKNIINRINIHLQFTEVQAGAQPGKNPLNNLLALKSVIQKKMTQDQETHIAFIDLEKTFDKVWRSAIFYLLWKRAIRGIMHKLSNNQETRFMTKFGLTDTMVMEDSITQGRPLSDPEFGLLIDELNVELRTADLVVQYDFTILICLLFMDDIALLARSAKELQEKLNITSLFLNKWHLKINIQKSAVMIFRNNIHQTFNNKFQTGTQKLNIQKQH